MSIRDDIRRDGYVIARSILSPTEIALLRTQLLQHFHHSWNPEGLGKHQPNAAVEITSISWIYTHPAILAVFRELSGQDRLVFTGNSDAHMNMLSWWHKDTGEQKGGCFSGDYFTRSECNVYRAGIYLQDHTNGNGLTVKKGSHLTRSLTRGSEEALRTAIGDVVFFDIRLTHAGQFADAFEAALLRVGKGQRARTLASAVKTGYQQLRGKPDKLSVFMTYGTPAQDTQEFCEYELKANRLRNSGQAMHLPTGLIKNLEEAKVSFNSALAPCTADSFDVETNTH